MSNYRQLVAKNVLANNSQMGNSLKQHSHAHSNSLMAASGLPNSSQAGAKRELSNSYGQ